MKSIYSNKSAEELNIKYQSLVKKISTEDLRGMLSILLCDPEIASTNLFTGKLEIEKLDDKEREYHFNNSAKLQSYDKQKYEELYSMLKNDFRILEKEEVPNPFWEEAPDILKSSIKETTHTCPKSSLLTALIKSTLNLRDTGKELPDEQTIRLIECFTSDHSENDYSLVINEDYLHPLKVSKNVKIWGMFFDLLQNGYLDRNGETQNLYDYLNFNPNNRIKTNTKYPLQKIIQQNDSDYKPLFKVSIQTEKALTQRQNKIKSST